jgi:hypothetical protein
MCVAKILNRSGQISDRDMGKANAGSQSEKISLRQTRAVFLRDATEAGECGLRQPVVR